MKLKTTLLFCCLFFSVKIILAQTKIGVEGSWFFTKQSFAGNIMVDENGKRLTKSNWFQHFVYVETNTKNNIQWQHFKYKNKVYQVTASLIKDSAVLVGVNSNTHQPIIIKPKKTNQLWLLNINNFENEITKTCFSFILSVKVNNKKKHITLLKKPICLEPELHP